MVKVFQLVYPYRALPQIITPFFLKNRTRTNSAIMQQYHLYVWAKSNIVHDPITLYVTTYTLNTQHI